jgi:hypothetical protein
MTLESTRANLTETINDTEASIKKVNKEMLALRLQNRKENMREVIILDGFRQSLIAIRDRAEELYNGITLTVQEA